MKKIIVFSFLLLSIKSFAQSDIGLNFSKSIWQSNATNPALMPKNKFVIASPSIYAGFYNSFGGLFVKNNLTQIASSNTTDYIAGNREISFGGLGFAIGKNGYLSLSQAIRTEGSLTGSGNLFQAIISGNAQFIGKTIDFAPNIRYNKYNELAATYAHNLGKLTIGGKVKLFTGLASIKTGGTSSLALTTSDDIYQLKFDLDYKLQASQNVANILGDFKTAPSFSTSKLSGVDGIGMGLDLGATYDINDKISISASATNLLASIKWNGGKEYSTKAKFNIDGVDIVKLIKDSTFSLQTPNLDTVIKNMNFKTMAADFRTSPSRTFILTGAYKVNNFLTTNALLGFSEGRSYVALNATANLKSWVEAGLTYSIRNRSFSDIGANVAVKLGPVQAYCIADNFLGSFKPFATHNYNIRVGANIAFGTTPRYQKVASAGNEHP